MDSKKEEDNNLKVLYKGKWIQLNYKNNTKRYYSHHVLRQRYGTELCYILGIANPRKYWNEYYEKHKKRIKEASKKHYNKMKKKKQKQNLDESFPQGELK